MAECGAEMTDRAWCCDYGSGNLASAERALRRTGASVEVTADFETALNADGLVVPGVGAYEACMAGLTAVRGQRIIDRRVAGGRPVLGICVGMQILFDRGVEHGVQTDGVGEWPGTVERLQAPIVPHMGWNTVEPGPGSVLFAGTGPADPVLLRALLRRPAAGSSRSPGAFTPPVVTWAEHGGDRFVAAVENGPLSATQFHPEKSGDAGAEVLRRWVHSI